MYTLVRQVHLYTGLALALVMFVLAVTGAALVYKEAYWRAAYPELGRTDPEPSPADIAAAVRAARNAFGGDLRSVKLPEPGVPAYHLYLTDGEAFLSAGDHRVIDRWGKRERVMAVLFDLHAHLMAGETGERVAGFVSLAGALMAITGLVLWWPARRRFRIANLWPRDLSRRSLLRWHRDLGLVLSPVLLLLLLTGSGIVFYGTAGAILNGLFGDRPPATAPPPRATGAAESALPDAAGVAHALAVFAEARLVFVTPPAEPGAPVIYRLKRACELHPNGRSYVYADPATGAVLGSDDACAAAPGQAALHALYPLHAGKIGSALYKVVVLLGGLVLAMLSATGVITYLRGLVRRRERSCDNAQAPASSRS